jgi:hypothetical protein
VSSDFLLQVFSRIIFPQAPENNIRAFQIYEFASQVHHRYNDTDGKFATGVNDIGSKFAAGVNYTGGNLPPVSTTPAVNLPLVSTTPVANIWNNIRLLTP